MVTVETAAAVVPSPRQLAWQGMEFYAFIHFGMNTFTGQEWGDGTTDPALFHPEAVNPAQWVEACKSAGMSGLILTCKHHDGFCLWPSQYTDYSVTRSPWEAGRSDLVRDTAAACRAGGIRFGIYLSPWDRHEPSYGDSPAYNAFYLGQLRELLTGYGELFCVWLDGACGEGSNGHRQEYDWDAYYALIRELQPGAVISVCGPDVRWCGNEAGHTRQSEWSVVPAAMQDNERIAAKSQQSDDRAFARQIGSGDEDIGSRDVLKEAGRVVWYPAEVNTSIRPGWFYHAEENAQVKQADELFELYERSVGGNASLLLNLPPDKRGLIHEEDVRQLQLLGERLRTVYGENRSPKPESCQVRTGTADNGKPVTEMILEFDREVGFDRVVLREDIRQGQRVERFELLCERGGEWEPVYAATVIGNKKICRLAQKLSATRILLRVTEARMEPVISRFELYSTCD